jgi:hypothetical protein
MGGDKGEGMEMEQQIKVEYVALLELASWGSFERQSRGS